MNNKIIYIAGGVIVGILITVFFASVMSHGSYRRGMMSLGDSVVNNVSEQSTNSTVPSSLDQHFIEQMIPHHEGAIQMAKLALTKSTHPEIKVLAQAIIKSQSKEIEDMRGWYTSWFGKNVPEGVVSGGGMMSQGGMHMGGQEDMAALEYAKDFDKAFIEQMIPHHQLALMMVQMLQSGTSRPEMLELAKNITTSQSAEIQKMQTWYAQWYK
jgi:uncharacterized protein (DUF305 family)